MKRFAQMPNWFPNEKPPISINAVWCVLFYFSRMKTRKVWEMHTNTRTKPKLTCASHIHTMKWRYYYLTTNQSSFCVYFNCTQCTRNNSIVIQHTVFSSARFKLRQKRWEIWAEHSNLEYHLNSLLFCVIIFRKY